MPKKFTITERIAKHGKQAVIIVPSILKQELKPGTIAEISIEILQDFVIKRLF